jgi:excisionase family DNA binding protein
VVVQVLVEEEALRRLVREEAQAAVRAALNATQAPSVLLTAKEAGELLGMTEAALRRSAQRGIIPSLTLPTGRVRFERSALESWMRSAS